MRSPIRRCQRKALEEFITKDINDYSFFWLISGTNEDLFQSKADATAPYSILDVCCWIANQLFFCVSKIFDFVSISWVVLIKRKLDFFVVCFVFVSCSWPLKCPTDILTFFPGTNINLIKNLFRMTTKRLPAGKKSQSQENQSFHTQFDSNQRVASDNCPTDKNFPLLFMLCLRVGGRGFSQFNFTNVSASR